jgi:tetratricopeptide (TPR) repeat protein
MAFCEQCGNKISDTAKFCGKCGAPVVSGQPEAQAEIPQASRSGDNESLAVEAYNAGMACIEAEQYDKAIAHFTEAIRLHPNPSGAYYKRGQIYGIIIGDHDRAIADYTSALQIANKKEDIYCARGQAYYTKQQYDNAIADFNQAIRLAPNQAEYYSARGKAYACLGDFDTGIADFTKAIQIAPDVAETYGCRGAAYLEKGDPEKARADLERGLSIDPNDETLVELAEVFNEAMSAPGTCAQCGAPLDEDEVFCSNCGAKVGAGPQAAYQAPMQQAQYQPDPTLAAQMLVQAQMEAMSARQYQPIPAQSQGQIGGDGVLKEGRITLHPNSFMGYNEEGNLLLYRDRLEWKGETYMLIPIEKITSVITKGADFKITLDNNKKYEFDLSNTEKRNEFVEIRKKKGSELEKAYKELGEKSQLELKSWVDAINSVRNGTLG